MTVQLRTIPFEYYEGLADRVLASLTEAEDELITAGDHELKRTALYGVSRDELEKKWGIGANAKLETPSQAWQENLADHALITAANAPGDPMDESVIINEPQAVGF